MDELVCFIIGATITAAISIAISLYTILAKSDDARKTWPASFRAFIAVIVGFELGAHLVFACTAADLCLASSSLQLCFYLLPMLLVASLALLLISIHRRHI